MKIVVFSGAGVSAESGLKTFRDSDGLWEEYDIMEVATPEAWARDPKLVLDFYNMRRKQVLAAQPNAAHHAIAALEKHFDVEVITQNIDDLHERAGSSKVLHLHGEVRKGRSTYPPFKTYDVEKDEIRWGDICPDGYQLRPHVVWFGEEVPNIPLAEDIIATANVLMIVGTSLNVYPAAGLIHAVRPMCQVYLVDPNEVKVSRMNNVRFIQRSASAGVPELCERLIKELKGVSE